MKNLVNISSLWIVRNVESNKEFIKPGSYNGSDHGADYRDPEPFIAAITKNSPTVASAESKETRSKVTSRINGISC